jgi:hypothetical protein
LPAWSSDRQPLAVLRPSWQKNDDMLVLDHRQRGTVTQLELIGAGHSWLGPSWNHSRPAASATFAKPRFWLSNSSADLAEWSFRTGGVRIVRSALLLRGRQIALLSDQVEGDVQTDQAIESQFELPPDVTAESLRNCRGMLLRRPGRKMAQVLPLALPCLPYETDRGKFHLSAGRVLSLRIASKGRRSWLPVLVSWNPERHRKPLSWRILTVSERSKNCSPDVAFAVRLSWGRDDTLVIYRSLAAPARRAFLGHLTTDRFLVGNFTRDGAVEPILSVDC